ncbi:MAG: hypothetical protein M1825_001743 [Sarcosagium campestre]|nr:MAG: hypothetical protein M1825_001743 [Sarcosagium campestre]
MASIFTYDPDPPRVSSPWLQADPSSNGALHDGSPRPQHTGWAFDEDHPSASLADFGLSRLKAEPQEGPTEYKLHLLLRPRRTFTAFSTSGLNDGARSSSTQGAVSMGTDTGVDVPRAVSSSPHIASSNQSRQTRMRQLTTQLLWRLQQSSPYHSSSSSSRVEAEVCESSPKFRGAASPDRLLPGLQESDGALYEIGVSDDGTLVGLAKDEMDESLDNLRAMAVTLGCTVRVQRMVKVGTCEWLEGGGGEAGSVNALRRTDKLWVSEALVAPDSAIAGFRLRGNGQVESNGQMEMITRSSNRPYESHKTVQESEFESESLTAQLRVTFTGASTSGKSSLLGTLSTGTLDNGRGKSRLSLLRHRHELVSGVTSSVTQEIVGYRSIASDTTNAAEVINYASGNVSSWTDIHTASASGRVVLFSDSAGHPRYRRTIVRGLVGWAPHWTFLCIAADQDSSRSSHGTEVGESSSSSESHSQSQSGVSSTSQQQHLELCLTLGLPLVVVITKLDVASKTGLKETLTRLLSRLKAAARKPILLPSAPTSARDLSFVSHNDETRVEKLLDSIRELGCRVAVPIILSSSVAGTGVGAIHALLRRLPKPLPSSNTLDGTASAFGKKKQPQEIQTALFHVEDSFNLQGLSAQHRRNNAYDDNEEGYVVAGLLSRGDIQLGDELLMGPFVTVKAASNSAEPASGKCIPSAASKSVGPSASSTSHSSSPSSTMPIMTTTKMTTTPPGSTVAQRRMTKIKPMIEHHHHQHHQHSSPTAPTEWRRMRVVSLRSLRLPVRRLFSGDVGTVGLVDSRSAVSATATATPSAMISIAKPMTTTSATSTTMTSETGKIRKGMVLLGRRSASSSKDIDSPEDSTPLPRSSTGLKGRFAARDVRGAVSVGNDVVVYIASVRATAKLVQLELDLNTDHHHHHHRRHHDGKDHVDNDYVDEDVDHDDHNDDNVDKDIVDSNHDSDDSDDDGDDGDHEDEDDSDTDGDDEDEEMVNITFRLLQAEYIEVGSRVLVMPGGGPGFFGSGSDNRVGSGEGGGSSGGRGGGGSSGAGGGGGTAASTSTSTSTSISRAVGGLEGFVGTVVQTTTTTPTATMTATTTTTTRTTKKTVSKKKT